ncbi:ribonuclease P protein subunit p25 [Bombina bombina]|uniref:ribonuclease P protein subunit p25 n=1 Tax=Bombina bombina TaxID=8345 RepID=UPI00235AD1D1|nr:ribonuclease P protein subunit p25 [Bombina bombina]
MENFQRVRILDEDNGKSLPFKNICPDVVQMRVKEGSKIRNLITYALGYMESEAAGQIIFSAHGRAVTKAVTCVEILKRQVVGLHQVTKVQYKTLHEVWEQKGPKVQSPAPSLTVQKYLPSICILLSKVPLDPQETGYQPPQPVTAGKCPTGSQVKHFVSKKRKLQQSVEEKIVDKSFPRAQSHQYQLSSTLGEINGTKL